jgi:transcriptional regulator with XRE-family HTH domain
MPSFRITLSPTKRAAGRFVYGVRRKLQKAYSEEQKKRGLTQTAIAREIGVHRSVINRELRGGKDITLGRVAELATALGRRVNIEFPEMLAQAGQNVEPDALLKAVADYSCSEETELREPSDVEFELEAAAA